MQMNQQFLANPLSSKSIQLLEDAIHTVEKLPTIIGKSIMYDKYTFQDGTDFIECNIASDDIDAKYIQCTEKEFLKAQNEYLKNLLVLLHAPAHVRNNNQGKQQ